MSQKGQTQTTTDLHREIITLWEASTQNRMIQAALHIYWYSFKLVNTHRKHTEKPHDQLFSKFLKNLTSCGFSLQKHAKSIQNSCLNLWFVRILARWLWHCMSSSLGTRLVVILWICVAPPCIQRLGAITPCHSDMRPGCSNRLCSYALVRSWTMFVPRLVLCDYGLCPVNLGNNSVVVFMRSGSCRLGCNRICA